MILRGCVRIFSRVDKEGALYPPHSHSSAQFRHMLSILPPIPPTVLPLTASPTHLLSSQLLYPLALPRGSDGPKATLQYERDLGPGEYFGEAVLSGVRTRSITAIAMTSCDLVSFEDDDFLAAQVREGGKGG
jgi:CRP-like cAMP-binding protein